MNRFKLLFPILILPFLTTCTLDTEYFKDYKDLNLIGNMPFGGAWPDGTPYWQTLTYNDTLGIDPYMNWEPVATVSPPADAPGAPVYRLEIKNLIPNGDFTNPDISMWAGVDSPSSPSSLRLQRQSTVVDGGLSTFAGDFFTPLVVGNDSLWLTLQDTDEVTLNLSTFAPDLEEQYLLRYNFRSYGNHALLINGKEYTISFQDTGQGSEDLSMKQAFYIPTGKDELSAFYIPLGTEFPLAFNSKSVSFQNLSLDDVQMINVDQQTSLLLKVPKISDTVKPLLQGALYTFSIAVKDEDPVDLTPLTPNAYPSQALTIKLTFMDNALAQRIAMKASISRPVGGWSTWTRISFDLSNYNTLNFPTTYEPTPGAPPVFQIEISPTEEVNLDSPRCGRILISDPRFIFREKR